MSEGVIRNLMKEELNACRVLDLKGEINEELLKKKYRDLAKVLHPDVGGSKEKFVEVQLAYETLSKITPFDCSQSNREYEELQSYIYGTIRRETDESKNRRYSKYAPDGFTKWREYL